MADPQSPWQPNPRKAPQEAAPRPNTGFLIWIAAILAAVIGFVELSRLFPNAIRDGNEVNLVYLVGLLALVSRGFLYGRQGSLGETARNIAIWLSIAVVALIGYSYQNELSALGTRLWGELVPSYAVSGGKGEVVVTEGEGNAYRINGDVNGTTVTFQIDTGAADIVLSPDDAQRVGIDVAALKFDRTYGTANGFGQGAVTTVETLSAGGITLHNVEVSINRASMDTSLLGIAFLRRLKSYEFRDRKLYLRT